MLATLDEARAHRGRSAEEIQQQPGMPAEIADQGKVGVVRGVDCRQREVVVDAGDRLHAPAVAVGEADAVNRLGAADVRAAVAPDGDRVVAGQAAGHARAPEHFVADAAIDDLVDAPELFEAGLDVRVHAGDQLELRFAEIGGDMRMRQRRTERARMRVGGERPVGQHAQALLLDAAAYVPERVGAERAQTILESAHSWRGPPVEALR